MNTLGKLFRATNWGESHGKAIGVVIDGCPSLLSLSEKDIQYDLDRRKPGQSSITTSRTEEDKIQILSGVYQGKTTGTPISLLIWNKDYANEDYKEITELFRPSHADFTYTKKYGLRDPFGGGRSSARLTAGWVAAGAIAKKILREAGKIEIIAYVKSVKNIVLELSEKEFQQLTTKKIEMSLVRCPDKKKSEQMINVIEDAKQKGDSVGGIIECIIKNVPQGLGQPLIDKLEADLGKAMLSINATKGFEIGSGFKGTELTGSQHNDEFVINDKMNDTNSMNDANSNRSNSKVYTSTNNSGGIQGGISNGMPIIFRVAFKPTATIAKEQNTVDIHGNKAILAAKGRHDPCVLPRAVPIVEAMAALVLCDHYLRSKTDKHEN